MAGQDAPEPTGDGGRRRRDPPDLTGDPGPVGDGRGRIRRAWPVVPAGGSGFYGLSGISPPMDFRKYHCLWTFGDITVFPKNVFL